MLDSFKEFCLSKTKKIINHKDFTNIPFVTIDGQDSKDFDDAVWSETKKGITNIMIAISDVSFFIEKNDPLDLEAKKRGNSFCWNRRYRNVWTFFNYERKGV